MTETKPDPSVIETPPILKQKSTPQQKIIRIVLTVIMLALIAYVLLGQMSNVEDVGEAIDRVSAQDYLLLFLIAFGVEITKAGPGAILVELLTWTKAFVSNEASGTISNTIPGPSGTTMRYLIYRSWGVPAEDFGRSTIVNSIVNNTIQLTFPIISIILVSLQSTSVPANIWWLAGISAVLSIGALIICYLMARSERIALWIGHKSAKWYAWFRGLRRKPIETDVLSAIVKFRVVTLRILGDKFASLFTVLIGKYFLTFFCFLVSMRAVGIPYSALTVAAAFAVYAMTRVLTIVEVTPGGIGVTEFIYVSLLEAVLPASYDNEVVAGVLVFRAFTYFMPIVLGGLCYVFWTFKRSWRVDNESRKAVSVA